MVSMVSVYTYFHGFVSASVSLCHVPRSVLRVCVVSGGGSVHVSQAIIRHSVLYCLVHSTSVHVAQH